MSAQLQCEGVKKQLTRHFAWRAYASRHCPALYPAVNDLVKLFVACFRGISPIFYDNEIASLSTQLDAHKSVGDTAKIFVRLKYLFNIFLFATVMLCHCSSYRRHWIIVSL